MNALRHVCNLFLLAVPVSVSGGAAAYHDYACGCPPYGYCPPSPLPYTGYCGCPTPAALHYGHEPFGVGWTQRAPDTALDSAKLDTGLTKAVSRHRTPKPIVPTDQVKTGSEPSDGSST
jgi:hypothetical protein